MTLGPKTTTGDRGDKAFAPVRSVRRLTALAFSALLIAAAHAQSSSTYKITATLPATVPAGAAGVSLALSGTFPDFSQNTYQVCFYTGSGSAAPLTPAVVAGVPTITVPATTIQAIPSSNFTSANGFSVPALVSIVPAGVLCDGTYNASLTNSLSVAIVEPVLTAFVSSPVVPQTNPTTNIQAPPTTILLSGSNFAANTTASFQGFSGAVTRVLTPNSLSVTVPAAFAASSSDTTSTLTVCNSGSGSATFCSSTDPPFTVSLSPLYPSAAFLTVTPSPTTTAGQTTLSAQFSKGDPANPLPNPGAPSGTVTFGAGSTSIPPAKLILDPTATFVQQTSTVTTPATATPAISPPAGNYLNSVTISIADATPGAAIYYTRDGSTPTAASTPYTAPFQITTSQTIQAIAASSGALNSTVAAVAYTITISPPTKLAFAVQPVSTPIGAAITPAIQVAIQDVNGNTVTTSTLPVTLALAANPGQSTLSGTRTVNAVNGIATFSDLNLNNIATGYTLTATSGNLTSATSAAFNITPPPITMAVQSALIGINSTLNGTATLGQPAGSGGVVVSFSSSTPANVTISPSSLTIPQGQVTGAFTYTGVASGNATLSASATNYQTGTVQVTGTAAQVSLGTIPPVAPGQSVSLALSLPSAAPSGGTTVTFTSSNTNVATVTSSIFVPAGQRTAATNPQITGILIGTTNIVASAPGYAPDTRAVNVTVVASISPGTTYINLATSTTTTLNISAPAQTGGLTFNLTSDNPAVAAVPATVTVVQGSTSVQLPITGIANGSTTIRANATGVTEATGGVQVTSTIAPGNTIVGGNLWTPIDLYLPVSPPAPTTVTVTADNASVFTIAKDQTVVGTTTQTFTNVTGSYIGRIYIQGHTVGGASTITISAPGYTTGSGNVTVYPSGFSLYPYSYGNSSTTTFSSPTTFTIATNVLTPGTLNIYTYNQALNPGVTPVSISVTSSNTAVGTIAGSLLTFAPGDYYKSFTFTPASAGTTNLAVGAAPAGFSTPAQYQQITETVTAPSITIGNTIVGVKLQTYFDVYLPVAPPSGVTVTVTSSAPTLAILSQSATVVGLASQTFTNVTGSYVGRVYVQGQAQGSSTITVAAPGYTSGTGTISIYPSGFSLYPYSYSSFTTTTFSSPTNITIATNVLDPNSLNIYTYNQPLSPGVSPISLAITSSNTSTGTISTSPVTFSPGDYYQTVTFTPSAAGTSNLALGATPAGFSTPAQYQQITATVTAPAIYVSLAGGSIVGVKMQVPVDIYLQNAPPSATAFTITTSGPSLATISQSASTAGTTSQTFTNVTSTYVGRIYVQGQNQGSITLTATATGYSSGTAGMSIYPSGFSFYPYNSTSFSTTTFSAPNNITVATTVLDPNSLGVYTYNQQLNPGITATVSITSSTPSVGAISGSPVVFGPGDVTKTVTFSPGGAGSTTIALGTTPAGFSTPSNYQQIAATVTAPSISVSNSIVGVTLQVPVDIYLPVAPPNAVTVTVLSNGAAISTISKTTTDVGVASLSFLNTTSTYAGRIYVQAQSIGSTTITVSAPGYTNGTGTVTVYPTGFSFYPYSYSNFTTTTTSSPTNITVSANPLNPGSLTVYTYNQQLNPGIATVSIPVTSSNTSVGTITTSPVVFNGSDNNKATSFQPLSTGNSTITLGTPQGYSTPSQYQQITATVQ